MKSSSTSGVDVLDALFLCDGFNGTTAVNQSEVNKCRECARLAMA